MNKKERAAEILKRLRKIYTKTEDDFVAWSNPLELVIATVLSAQCTDKRVNMVTKDLFKKYKKAHDYATAPLEQLEKDVKPTGFYRSKAKYLKGIGEILMEKHKGLVPENRDALLQLPGVSFKTADLVMAKAFGKATGVAVDTHVNRLSARFGLTDEKKSADKKAADLEKWYPSKDWLDANEYMILHGRAVCVSRKPRCPECPLKDICPSAKKFTKQFWS